MQKSLAGSLERSLGQYKSTSRSWTTSLSISRDGASRRNCAALAMAEPQRGIVQALRRDCDFVVHAIADSCTDDLATAELRS